MEENPPPFWVQNHHYHHHHNRRHRHRGSNIFLNTGVLILILISTAIIFLYIAIPSMLSIARQVFDPNLVKTSWTSLNIVLVLFAILCGFLGKKDDIEGQSTTPRSTTTPTKQDSINKNVDSDSQNDDKVRRLLRRNSNSYPDLRQDSPWIAKQNAWPRFYDDHYYYQLQRSDSKISGYYQQKAIPSPAGSPYPDRTQVYGYYSPSYIKTQDVPTPSSPPPPQPLQQPPPPSPLPELAAVMPSKDESEAEVNEMLDMKHLSDSSDPSIVLSPTPVQTPPPPPQLPTPPPPPQQGGSPRTIKKMRKQRDGNNQGKHKEDSNKNEKSHKKRSGVSVTKDFITSFYHQRKRKKKQNRQSYDNFDEIYEPSHDVSVPIYRSKSTPEFPPPSPPPPPPPPPPLPPHSVMQNLFSSRKTKNKKHVPPPPPPPPPVPPPYRTPSWKFLMQDANTESSNNSPRSGYSASEEDDGSPSTSKINSPTPTVFCPSPDVNTKADDFIARFRAKLTLEKLNSIKLKQGTGPSPLGMDFGQS